MKVSWAVETISINIALFVTLLYWSAVHGYVLQYKLLEDEADWMFNIFNHSFNTLLSILDLIISARPVSLYHAYLPVMYGLLYSLFSLLYWLLGGKQIIHLTLTRSSSFLVVENNLLMKRCSSNNFRLLDRSRLFYVPLCQCLSR